MISSIWALTRDMEEKCTEWKRRGEYVVVSKLIIDGVARAMKVISVIELGHTQ